MSNAYMATSTLLLLSLIPACGLFDARASQSDESSNSDFDETTGSAAVERVDLGMAEDFAILAKSGISTVPLSEISGDLGLSPAAATFITGFSLTMSPTDDFATSEQVLGSVYSADYAPPTPSNLTGSVEDMEVAFIDAAGRAPDTTELGAGDIGGLLIEPGVYKWGTGLLVPTDIILNGSASDVWIFQVAQDFVMSSDTEVLLSGGAQAKNIFWQVGGRVELGTTAHCVGIILAKTSITLRTGASVDGRLLAQTAVNLEGSTVTEPAE